MIGETVTSSHRPRRRLVIVGNGLATDSLIGHLGTDHPWSVRVLGDEPVRHYNRIMLSPLLGGETDLPSISPRDESWYRARRVTVSPGKRVTGIDRAWARQRARVQRATCVAHQLDISPLAGA